MIAGGISWLWKERAIGLLVSCQVRIKRPKVMQVCQAPGCGSAEGLGAVRGSPQGDQSLKLRLD